MPMRNCMPHSGVLITLFIFLFGFAGIAQKTVTGKVIGPDSKPVADATVNVKGTTTSTTTSVDGAFSIKVPTDASILVISYIGNEPVEVSTAGKDIINVTMVARASGGLDEIVVTGYTTQKKKDIIGAVAVVSPKDLLATPSSNIAMQLQGRAPGVLVSTSGDPGAPAVVRIRGFGSAGNNDPLYIIDGVPTDDASKINPFDVESMQVLKDASSASIYGSRASNGVIIITTKQGKSGRINVNYDGYVGSQIVTDKMTPDMLNTAEYMQYLDKSTDASFKHPVFGQHGAFKIPDFIINSAAFKGGVAASDPKANPDNYSIGSGFNQILKTSNGTQWFDELTQPGLINNHQISASGGTEKAVYSIGANYFDQKGSFIHTYFKRYTVRVNSTFKPSKWLRLGENVQVSYEDRLGGSNRGEGDAWASGFRMVPYIPVYDIKDGWGGNGVGESGNGSNPVANLTRQKNNTNKYTKVFGNVFAEIPFATFLTGRTSFGIDMGNQFVKNISIKTYERSENQGNTQLTEESWYYMNWTWTNTLNFQKVFFENHDVKLLLGSEAVKNNSRGLRAFGQNFDFDTPDFISLNTAVAGSLGDRGISNYNIGRSTLYSYFARLDYTFKNKYLINGTFRRDGSSRFGANVRYANFPSVGIGWRVSEEGFMKSISWLQDLKLRAGWGQMGSQSNISATNPYSTFISSPGRTNYDINGANSSSSQGYRAGQEGNQDTKWETSETTNFGLDATILNGLFDISIDVYKKDTKDLLVPQFRNGLEPIVDKPNINIGTMRNTGFDIGLNHRKSIGKNFRYDIGITFSRYKNTMTKLNEEGTPRNVGLERLSNVLRTENGQPISSYYGFVLDGFHNNAADVAATIMPDPATVTIGSYKYKDLNGDKKIDDKDRTFLGSPHPDFQMGTNLGVNWKGLSLTAFLFWNKGNEIYNYVKYYTDMRAFVGGVSTRVLYDSWTPTNTNAKLPQLGVGANNGYTSFTTSTSNSYYVEDGSYLRLKNLQIGYDLPRSIVSKVKLQGVRIYVQGQNLFTFTKYQGADPDITAISRDPFGLRDYYIGVDLGGFPNTKQYLAGLSVSF